MSSGVTTLPPHARVAAWCALLPNVWNSNSGGVRFTITVSAADGRRLGQRSLVARPSVVKTDRRWRRLAVRAGNRLPQDVRITFETSLPDGASTAHAWSVWGDPQIERNRSLPAMTRFLRGELKERGVVGAFTGLRIDLQRYGEDAARYERWVARHTPDAAALESLASRVATLSTPPRFSVLIPVYNTEPRWLKAAIESVKAQVYRHWEICIADDASTSAATRALLKEYEADPRVKIVWRPTNGHIALASNDALALATGDYIALLDHDDVLTPDALAEMALAIDEQRDVDVLYSDEDKLTLAGTRCDPFFKPDWSPEHFLGQMYTCHLTIARTALMREVGGFRAGFEGAQDYDLWLRMMARTRRIHHVPKVLYHWRKIPGSAAAVAEAKPYALDNAARALDDYMRSKGVDAGVEPGLAPGLWRVRRRIVGEPDVTIVIPTAGRTAEMRGQPVDLLAHALRSVVDQTTWRELSPAGSGQRRPAPRDDRGHS